MLIGIATIYAAVRNNTRQLGAQIFLSYSDRIHRLRRSLSNEYYSERRDGELDADPTPEARRFVLEIMQLVFEMHALKRHGYVDRHIWRVWEPDIDRLLRGGAVRREWPGLEIEFAAHPKFVRWVLHRQNLGVGHAHTVTPQRH